jgi:hypothetical protein
MRQRGQIVGEERFERLMRLSFRMMRDHLIQRKKSLCVEQMLHPRVRSWSEVAMRSPLAPCLRRTERAGWGELRARPA